jgi:hypothetical protein
MVSAYLSTHYNSGYDINTSHQSYGGGAEIGGAEREGTVGVGIRDQYAEREQPLESGGVIPTTHSPFFPTVSSDTSHNITPGNDMNIYVCMYVYIIFVLIYVYTDVYMYKHIYIDVYIFTSMYRCSPCHNS